MTNRGTGIWAPGKAWRVVEETRIGKMEDEGPDLFGYVVWVALDQHLRIWVLERHAREIRVFERDGRHVRTFGRKGGGPGEFQDPLGMAFGPGERLWVADPQFGRVTVFDTVGNVIATHRTPGGYSTIPWPGAFDRHGRFYDVVPDPAERLQHQIVRYDSTFRRTATLRAPRWGALDGAQGAARRFSPRWLWAVAPEGDLWVLHTGQYRLNRVSPGGDTVRTVIMPAQSIPLSDGDRRVASEASRRNRGRADDSPIPGSKPSVAALFVADDGYIWVARDGSGADQYRRADVFDPDGRYLGVVDLPFQLMAPVVFRDTHLATVVWGPMGVHFVALARIERP